MGCSSFSHYIFLKQYFSTNTHNELFRTMLSDEQFREKSKEEETLLCCLIFLDIFSCTLQIEIEIAVNTKNISECKIQYMLQIFWFSQSNYHTSTLYDARLYLHACSVTVILLFFFGILSKVMTWHSIL